MTSRGTSAGFCRAVQLQQAPAVQQLHQSLDPTAEPRGHAAGKHRRCSLSGLQSFQPQTKRFLVAGVVLSGNDVEVSGFQQGEIVEPSGLTGFPQGAAVAIECGGVEGVATQQLGLVGPEPLDHGTTGLAKEASQPPQSVEPPRTMSISWPQ